MEPSSSRLELDRRIRDLIGKGEIEQALAALYHYFTGISDKVQLEQVIALQAELAHLKDYEQRGSLTFEEACTLRARIATRTLSMLDVFQGNTTGQPAEAQAVRAGRLLHNIPPVMKTGALQTCRVRIATKDYQLRQRFYNPYDVRPITLERIGDKMEVEIESSDPDAFYIKRCNPHLQQPVEPDIATEWVFDVIPQKNGNHKLLLKVTIVQEQNGAVTHRDHVITIGVEVSAVGSSLPETWIPVMNIAQKAGFGALGAITRNLGEKLGQREGRRTAALALVVTALIAAAIFWIVPPNWQQEISNLIHAPWAAERTIAVIVHSSDDHVVLDFSITHARVNGLPKPGEVPGLWQTTATILRDTAVYDLYYKGDRRTRYWRLDSLPDTLHLFVNSFPVDKTGACPIIVQVDTLVTAVYDWELVISDTRFQEKFRLRAQPYDDTTFTVSLNQQACDLAYRTTDTSYFSFQNRGLEPNNTLTGPFGEEPDTLRFRYRSSFLRYDGIRVRINFTTPIEFTQLDVNGSRFEGEIVPTNLPGDTRLCKSLLFALYPATLLAATYRFRVNGIDCRCAEATLKTKDNMPSQEFTLTMNCVKGLDASPPLGKNHNPLTGPAKQKATVTLAFGTKWRQHLADMQIWLGRDRALDTDIVLDKQGRCSLPLDPIQPDRTICIRFIGGAKSGTPLEVACLPIRLGTKPIDLMLTDNNQLIRLR